MIIKGSKGLVEGEGYYCGLIRLTEPSKGEGISPHPDLPWGNPASLARLSSISFQDPLGRFCSSVSWLCLPGGHQTSHEAPSPWCGWTALPRGFLPRLPSGSWFQPGAAKYQELVYLPWCTLTPWGPFRYCRVGSGLTKCRLWRKRLRPQHFLQILTALECYLGSPHASMSLSHERLRKSVMNVTISFSVRGLTWAQKRARNCCPREVCWCSPLVSWVSAFRSTFDYGAQLESSVLLQSARGSCNYLTNSEWGSSSIHNLI